MRDLDQKQTINLLNAIMEFELAGVVELHNIEIKKMLRDFS